MPQPQPQPQPQQEAEAAAIPLVLRQDLLHGRTPNSSPYFSSDCMSTMSSNHYDSVLSQTQNIEEGKQDEEHLFMQQLKSLPWERYYYKKGMIHFHAGHRRYSPQVLYETYTSKFDRYDSHGPIISARDLVGVKHYSGHELWQITQSFSEVICTTLFGRLYRGTVDKESGVQDVIVKTWNFPFISIATATFKDHTTRLCDELNLLRDPEIKSHPNVANLIGFHCDVGLAVMYKGGQKETLHSMLASDEFLWNYRMNVAIEIADLLKTFHDKNLVYGGVNSGNILVDEAYHPVVFDFNCYSYLDDSENLYIPHVRKQFYFHAEWLEGPPWCVGNDIFAFGILLLELISKQGYGDLCANDVCGVVSWMEHQTSNCHLHDPKTSIVHHSFYIDEKIGFEITKLAINCLKVNLDVQPPMKDVMEELIHLVRTTPPNKQQKIST